MYENATTVSRRVARDENLKAIVGQLDGLGEDDKKLFIHRGLEGRRHHEVGDLLGISRDLAEKRWQRLRETLREIGLPDALVD